MSRVLVCGGRDYANNTMLTCVLDLLRPAEICHGDAPGADSLADSWARSRAVPFRAFPAKWKTLGMKAGPIRNQQMLDEFRPDFVLAFPGDVGTEDMTRRARKAGVPVLAVRP